MTWLTVDQAAVWCETTVKNTRVIAHRDGWHRRYVGRRVWYALDDVRDTAARRLQERTTPV